MVISRRIAARFAPSPSLALLVAFGCVLWLAGGASRPDAPGQVVVRAFAWAALVAAALAAEVEPQRSWRLLPVAALLLAGAGLALAQLVPLPPSTWTALPGREALLPAAAGGPQPWRPWSMVPGATLNALSSLVVPAAVLVLVAGLRDREPARLPGLLLSLIAAQTLLGLLQFSGLMFNNPLANDTPGQVSGTFANRNHFALFVAWGCFLAPGWAFLERGAGQAGTIPGWRMSVALALVALFLLAILASGSRAGLLVGALGLALGAALSGPAVRRALRRAPRWMFPALTAAVVALLAALVLLSVAADRAVSIDRAFAIDPGLDMRSRGRPVLGEMIRTYLPFGAGLGGFDPLFRMHEPFALLKPTYFNHAHNDYLEVSLDAGVPGLILLAAAIGWWGWASVRAWRAGPDGMLARLGSAAILLLLVASAFDYPGRTPLVMAMTTVAAAWLAAGARAAGGGSALPRANQ